MIAPVAGFDFGAVFGTMSVLSLIPFSAAGSMLMAVQKEIWIKDVVDLLFKNNAFLNFCRVMDEYVLQGKVVHIPQAGAAASATKNRSSLPATVVKRTDTDITFPLDEFTSDPVLIPNADTVELSYNKRDSVTKTTKSALIQLVAEWILRSWFPSAASNIVRTTGDAVAAHLPSATGNRKGAKWADISAIQMKMNLADIDPNDRYFALDAVMYQQLVDQLTETQYRDFSSGLDIANGIVGKRFGFNFVMRSTVGVYDNATTPVCKDPGATAAATDNAAGLAWQKDCVLRALGTTDMFENVGDPTYYGDIYSFLLRAGGRIYRDDAKGVFAYIQAASA